VLFYRPHLDFTSRELDLFMGEVLKSGTKVGNDHGKTWKRGM